MKKILLSLSVLFAVGASAQTPRMSLYEEFTGETCPPCAATNPGLNKILLSPVNVTKVIPIKWQVPIPSAPSNTWSLYQTNKNDINWRYRSTAAGGYGYISQNTSATAPSSGINSAPQGVMDGQHQWVFGATSDHPAYISDAVIASAQSNTAAFSIDMKHQWNPSMSAVIVTVNITASANYTSVGALVFRCVMVERLIQFSIQPGSNGEKVFEDVAISAYPTLQAGTSMVSGWINGQTQSFVLSCTPPTYTRRLDQISMVGFIQDDGTRKVAQATRSKAMYDASVVDIDIAPSCGANFAPSVNVQNLGTENVTSMTLTPYVDGIAGQTTTWTGNLPNGSLTNVVLNSLTSPATSGSHNFSVTITGLNGTDFNPANNTGSVAFPVYTGAAGNPVVEGFTATAFPPTGWTSVNKDAGFTWSRSNQAGGYWIAPFGAVKYDCYSNTEIGDQDELYLPAMDLRGGDAVEMSFDYAYAQKSAANNDKLEVMVSSNCGTTWNTVFSKSGAALSTCSSYTAGGPYIPDQNEFSQWTTVLVQLPGMNQSNVIAKFVMTNDNGNNLYLDNVNLVQHQPSGIAAVSVEEQGFSVYPNPASQTASIKFYSGGSGFVSVKVVSYNGQLIKDLNVPAMVGENQSKLDLSGMSSGLYFVKFDNGTQQFTQKLTVR
jgi:hypothetical protein